MKMTSSSLSSASVCFDCSNREHIAKPVVSIWLDHIREQINVERKVDINHYYYSKSLNRSEGSSDDCKYYSECENYDDTLSQKSEEQIKLQLYRDCLLIHDLERKLNNSNIVQYFSKGENEIMYNPQVVESNGNIVDPKVNWENSCPPLVAESLFVNNNDAAREDVSPQEEPVLNSTGSIGVVKAMESNKMSRESSTVSSDEDTSKNEINPVQCIGQVVIKVNEMKDSNKRLSLNLLLDKNFLDLCKHVSRVSTKTNEEITDVDKAQLSNATSIELTIPAQETTGPDEIDIDISLDLTHSSGSRTDSIYESALDLEDKVAVDVNEDVKLRHSTWTKQQRPQSMYESNKEDNVEHVKRINRTSLFEYSGTPFFFPSTTYVKRRHEQYLLDCDGPLCHIESTSIQQTIGLPGFEQEHVDPPESHSDLDSSESSARSLSSDDVSYESFTADGTEYNTLDSHMVDITSHTFETLLFVPRQSYHHQEQDSDVTCSRFSSMEAIVRDIVGHKHDDDIDSLKTDSIDSDVSIPSDVEQWMKDIFKEAFDDSDEDWKPSLDVEEETSLPEPNSEQKTNLELMKKDILEVQDTIT